MVFLPIPLADSGGAQPWEVSSFGRHYPVPGVCFRRGRVGSECTVALGLELSILGGGVQLEEGQSGALEKAGMKAGPVLPRSKDSTIKKNSNVI